MKLKYKVLGVFAVFTAFAIPLAQAGAIGDLWDKIKSYFCKEEKLAENAIEHEGSAVRNETEIVKHKVEAKAEKIEEEVGKEEHKVEQEVKHGFEKVKEESKHLIDKVPDREHDNGHDNAHIGEGHNQADQTHGSHTGDSIPQHHDEGHNGSSE